MARLIDLKNCLKLRPKNRLVFADAPDQIDPVMNEGELTSEKGYEAVRLSEMPLISRIGLMMGGAAAVDRRRAGVRDDLAAAMERRHRGQPAVNQIIDHRVTLELKNMYARQESQERVDAGYLSRKIAFPSRGAWHRIRGFFDGDERGGRYSHRIEGDYGRGLTARERSFHAAQQVIGGLSAAQLTEVQNRLGNEGHPFPGPPAPVGVRQPVFHLAQATPAQLLAIQSTARVGGVHVFQQPARTVLFPPREQPVPNTPFGRLLKLRQIEANARVKTLASNVYDSQRLQMFMDNMETAHPALHELIINMLDENELSNLEDLHVTSEDKDDEWLQQEIAARTVAPVRALIVHLEYVFNEKGPAALQHMLETARDSLAAAPVKEEVDEKEMTPEQKRAKKLEEASEAIRKIHADLITGYSEAEALGNNLYRLDKRYKELKESYDNAVAKKVKPDSAALNKAQQNLAAEQEKQKTLTLSIHQNEKNYRINAKAIQQITTAMSSVTMPRHVARFYISLNSAKIPDKESGDKALFGDISYRSRKKRRKKNNGDFQVHVDSLTAANLEDMQSDITEHYKGAITGRIKLTPRQMLLLLKEGEIASMGQFNEQTQRRYALMSTNLMITDAANIQLHKSANHELAERLGDTTLGMRWLARAGKWAKATMTSGQVYRSKDIIEHIAQKNLSKFRDIPADITLTELRDKLDGRGVTDKDLSEYIVKLSRMFMSFEVAATRGKVELYDKDARDMEQLISHLQVFMEEQRSRKLFARLNGQKGDPGEKLLTHLRETEKEQLEEQVKMVRGVMASIEEWGASIIKRITEKFKGKQYRDKMAVLKDMKKGGATKYELEDELLKDGLMSAAGMLGTAYATAEALSAAKKAALWSAGVARSTASLGWRAASAIGSGGVGVARRGVSVGARGASAIGRGIAYPFALAGRVLGAGKRWIKS